MNPRRRKTAEKKIINGPEFDVGQLDIEQILLGLNLKDFDNPWSRTRVTHRINIYSVDNLLYIYLWHVHWEWSSLSYHPPTMQTWQTWIHLNDDKCMVSRKYWKNILFCIWYCCLGLVACFVWHKKIFKFLGHPVASIAPISWTLDTCTLLQS